MATRTLATNLEVSAPITTASLTLAEGPAYNASLSLYMPVGTAAQMIIECGPSASGPWDVVHIDNLQVTQATGKNGVDLTHPVIEYSLNGVRGTRYRIRVPSITGTITVQSLVIRNTV